MYVGLSGAPLPINTTIDATVDPIGWWWYAHSRTGPYSGTAARVAAGAAKEATGLTNPTSEPALFMAAVRAGFVPDTKEGFETLLYWRRVGVVPRYQAGLYDFAAWLSWVATSQTRARFDQLVQDARVLLAQPQMRADPEKYVTALEALTGFKAGPPPSNLPALQAAAPVVPVITTTGQPIPTTPGGVIPNTWTDKTAPPPPTFVSTLNPETGKPISLVDTQAGHGGTTATFYTPQAPRPVLDMHGNTVGTVATEAGFPWWLALGLGAAFLFSRRRGR